MTLPSERTRAITCTEKFLISIMDKKATPRVPKEVREQARRLLRHYPSPWDIAVVTKVWPKDNIVSCPFDTPTEYGELFDSNTLDKVPK